MEPISEIIPFAKEMLSQRPNRSLVKIYMLGSTLAMLGMIGGMVETILLPFSEPFEDAPVEAIMEKRKKKKLVVKSHTTLVHPEVNDAMETVVMEAKAKHLVTAGRRNSANRLHAA
ncbi:G0/G1 switch protein 2 [Echeneis naucrates]|uniref:G0/G1 switch protein 2-like n=1 Tax=Echeneis naucrates TaxID=173247 RepID=A0A665TXD8_ECHNA|nr:G0/G1 switch protein 2-like [Echeneis naucrates]